MNSNLSAKVLGFMVAVGVFLGIVLWSILDLQELGANLPVSDVIQDYVIGLIYAGVVAVAIIALPIRDRGPVLVVWIFRMFVVFLFLPVYERHYDILDAYTYYHYGALRMVPAEYDDWKFGTVLIYRLNIALCALAADSYRALTVIYSSIGLWGGVLFYRALSRVHGENLKLFFVTNLIPSILLWTSPISKDALTFLTLGASFYAFSKFVLSGKRRDLLPMISCMLAAGLIRPWWAAILGSALLLAVVAVRQLPHRAMSLFVVGLTVLGSVGIIVANGLDNIDSAISTAEVSMSASSLGGSAQAVPEMRGWLDAVLFFPKGAATVLLRPFPWEAHNLFAFEASLENIGVFILLLLSVRHVWRQGRKDPLVVWGLGFMMAWLLIYSFAGYQNLGTSVRYRAPLLPVLVVLAGGGVTWLRSTSASRGSGIPAGASSSGRRDVSPRVPPVPEGSAHAPE